MKPGNTLTEVMASHPPHAIALSNGAECQLTYSELLRTIAVTGDQLKRAGIEGIAICGDNSIAQVVLDLACLHADIWTLQIPPFFSTEQIVHALKATGCRYVVTDFPADEKGIFNGKTDKLDIAGQTMFVTALNQASACPVLANTAKVTFTSGSTAQPKGLCLSTAHLLAPVQALALELAPLTLRRHLSVMPQAVLLETVAGIYTTLYLGACCIVPSLRHTCASNESGEVLRRSLDRYLAHTAILVPELLQQLVLACEQSHSSPASTRFLAVGGSRVNCDLLQRAVRTGLPVYEGYGLSEAGSVVTLNQPGANRQGAVGRVLPHQKIRIAEGGEIVLGKRGFLGYCGSTASIESEEFYTGDCGVIDADGYLHVNGRKKDVLITSTGRNVSPEWIESTLLDQPAISQAFVYGDAQASLSALIVSAQTTEQIQQSICSANLKLPAYARVCHWYRVEPFTQRSGLMTANGKPRRQAILDTIVPDVHHEERQERQDAT